jgi:DNA modification methylase
MKRDQENTHAETTCSSEKNCCFINKAGDLIIDPFNGGGTTGIASQLLGGRNYIGIEINREYCDLTVKRVKKLKENNAGAE